MLCLMPSDISLSRDPASVLTCLESLESVAQSCSVQYTTVIDSTGNISFVHKKVSIIVTVNKKSYAFCCRYIYIGDNKAQKLVIHYS